jgi:hypothetical protein
VKDRMTGGVKDKKDGKCGHGPLKYLEDMPGEGPKDGRIIRRISSQ